MQLTELWYVFVGNKAAKVPCCYGYSGWLYLIRLVGFVLLKGKGRGVFDRMCGGRNQMFTYLWFLPVYGYFIYGIF